jgi:hypothetical protein
LKPEYPLSGSLFPHAVFLPVFNFLSDGFVGDAGEIDVVVAKPWLEGRHCGIDPD